MQRRRPVLLAAFLLGVAMACGSSTPPGRTPSGGYVSCTVDADCVVTTFGGCCACCPSAPHALPKAKLDEQQQRCASASCGVCSDRLACPHVDDTSAFTATCKDGTCNAQRR